MGVLRLYSAKLAGRMLAQTAGGLGLAHRCCQPAFFEKPSCAVSTETRQLPVGARVAD